VTHLTTLLETASVSIVATAVPANDAPAARKRRGWLPVLTVLFLISYGLMTMLIVEQGATIESQRALLRELYRDSEELSALRTKALQEKTVADSQSHAVAKSKTFPSTQAPMTQTPSTQTPSATPSTQAPASTTPSSQAAQQRRTKNQTEKQKPQFQMPTKPASDLIDDPRNLNVI
jgi:predicted lipid-binding transport protein (Tim44 family)